MRKISMLLIGAAAAISATSAASAQNFNNRLFNELQWNFNTVYSDLSLYAKWVEGGVKATSAAIGNNFVADVEGSTLWRNEQLQLADVGATLTATVKAHGDVDLSAVGICNNASLTQIGGGSVDGFSKQRCNTLDPYALNQATVFGGADVSIAATAIANNLSVDTVSQDLSIGFAQANAAGTYANVNATVIGATGDVTATAVAIGNNASIKNRLPGM